MRVTIESWAFTDPRVFMLMEQLGITRRTATMLAIDVWFGTQERHLVKVPIAMIRGLCRPDGDQFSAADAAKALIDVGYLDDNGDGTVTVRGNAKHVDKLLKAKASAERRWDRSSHDPKAEIECERNANALPTQCDRYAYPDPDPDPDPDIKFSPNGESKRSRLRAPYETFKSLWETHRGTLAGIQELNTARKAKIRARWAERPDLAYWEAAVKRMAASVFCCEGNWATFDWLMKNENNHVKVSEGNYDRRDASAPQTIDWAKFDFSQGDDQ